MQIIELTLLELQVLQMVYAHKLFNNQIAYIQTVYLDLYIEELCSATVQRIAGIGSWASQPLSGGGEKNVKVLFLEQTFKP